MCWTPGLPWRGQGPGGPGEGQKSRVTPGRGPPRPAVCSYFYRRAVNVRCTCREGLGSARDSELGDVPETSLWRPEGLLDTTMIP